VSQAGNLALTKPEILASVVSLYADQLKPFGRVLLKRLRERAAERHAVAHGLPADSVDPEEMPRLNPRHLRKMCETCKQLRVGSEEGREFSVTLAGEPCEFLDVCSPVDSYPEYFWQQFAMYLDDVEEDDLRLPGGRYACARALMAKRLPFLQSYSLGQVCHAVQVAINARRLLGYNREGWLVPYRFSEGWVKEQCACAQASTGQEVHPVVSWEEACIFLQELLHSQHASAGGITLSNLKRLFRVHFERELSETALGHVRLLDLMRDSRLSDVCRLSVQGNGQTMVTAAVHFSPHGCPVLPPGMWTIPVTMCSVPMLTFFPVPVEASDLPEALVSPGASPRGSLWPEALVSPGSSPRGSVCGAPSFATESTAEGSPDSASESDEVEAPTSPFCLQDDCDSWSVCVKNTFIVLVEEGLSTSSSARRRHRSTPARSRAQLAH